MSTKVKTETAGTYQPDTGAPRASEDAIISQALDILMRRLNKPGALIDSPTAAADYLRLRFAQETSELFAVVWIDTPHRVIDCQIITRGSLDSCAVTPREVIKAALLHNAAACVLVHNHPSGDTTPSNADIELTLKMAEYLRPIGVTVLDHMIVGGALSPSGVRTIECNSLREQGYCRTIW